MSLVIVVLWQGVKIDCLLSRLIITNTALKLYLSITIDLKSIARCCHRCLGTKRGCSILEV
jgi:hypothetical protein